MIGELIEKLSIANTKLFTICDKKADMAKNPDDYSKQEMADVMRKDIELCKQRASLKNAIDAAINQAIIKGGVSAVSEVKDYGS